MKTLIAVSALVLSISALAAKPTSIKYVEDLVLADESIYSHYVVTCSDGKAADISAWDNRRQWCLGKGIKDACSKKQIKAAKQVCKG